MARIQFRGKVETVYNMDGSPAYDCIRVPKLGRRHCDMHAFRTHPKFGGLANSDLFPGVLAKLRKQVFGGDFLRLDRLPEGVDVDTSGFLAVVSAEV